MKNYTNNELKTILNNLKNDISYCGIRNGYGVGHIFQTDSGYIGWQHFGQSANRMTVSQLRFVVETIFSDCECIVEAQYSDYHINNIPKDKRYKGIDHSASHPNVMGIWKKDNLRGIKKWKL